MMPTYPEAVLRGSSFVGSGSVVAPAAHGRMR